ncbi:zinc finger protein 852 [Clinocottus analis]|uniref:zinc finger protein 852 n=1 Tax=Clinocottus analis TaxID=304258 RepID=UPI0035C0CBED
MSIDYTIDIQLTELGYPDLLQTSTEPPYRPTSPDDSFSPSQAQRLLVRSQQPGAGEKAGAAKRTTAVPTAPLTDNCTTQNPARDPQDEQAVKAGTTLESTVTDPPTGPEAADLPQIPEQGDHSEEDADDGDHAQVDTTEMLDAEDTSDGSDVSDVYEEEEEVEDDEEEEEEEDEERLNDESSQSGDFLCSVCDLQLPSKFKLQDHMNLHTGARPYSCAECRKRFCQIDSYLVHLRTHAQTKVDVFRCRICLSDFLSQRDLKVHLSRTHFEKEFYECDQCKRVFTSRKACEYHVRIPKCQLDVLCETCGRRFSTAKSLARHRKSTCHRSFKCTDCAKTFRKKNALLKHSFSHLGLLPYTCVRCRCHYRLAKLYRKHKCEPERIHCVACLREFSSQLAFQRHKKDTGCWGNQEPKGDEIRCLECGERFDTTEELKQHAGAHQRVLKCAECGKGFRSALLLMSHMGGHAANSPCLCQSCGLGFPHQQNYDSHLKTCGQTAPPAGALKKRKVNAKPDSSLPTAAVPAAVYNNPAAVNNAAAGTGGAFAGGGQSDGLWKLTLNEQPPSGVKLVVLLSVCPPQAVSLTTTSAVAPRLPIKRGRPKKAPPPANSSKPLGGNSALKTNGPSGLAAGMKRDPQWEAPLDLSIKPNLSTSTLGNVPLPPIKGEPGEVEISGGVRSTDRQSFKNTYSKVKVVKTNLGETDANTEGKQFEVDPMDLSRSAVDAAASGLIADVKKEPES